jgi:hypothetical protein
MTKEEWATQLCVSQTVLSAVEEGLRVPPPEMIAVLPAVGIDVNTLVRAHAVWAVRKATKAIQRRPGGTPWQPGYRRF